jgi:hypothetical protein
MRLFHNSTNIELMIERQETFLQSLKRPPLLPGYEAKLRNATQPVPSYSSRFLDAPMAETLAARQTG